MKVISVVAAALAVSLTGLSPSVASSTGDQSTGWHTTRVSTGPRALNHVNIYAPADDFSVHPAVLYLHGGGWKISKTESNWVKRFKMIAREQDWVLGIGYYPTTAAGGHSVRWVEAHAVKADLEALRAQSDVDPSKVAIYGDSAGGQLGALVAYQNPSEVAAVALSSGPVDMVVENHSIIKSDVEYYEGESYAKSKRKHDDRYQSTSPTSYITSASPPTYAFDERNDPIVPSAQFKELRRKLKHAGVDHRVLILAGSAHTPEDTYVPGSSQTAEQEGIDFINRAEQ
jgi:acetyl esterase/lipase